MGAFQSPVQKVWKIEMRTFRIVPVAMLVVLGAAWLPGVANAALPTGQIEVKSSQLNYASTGWGGWSCPPDHPFIVSASVENVGSGEGDLNITLWKPGATAGANSYPDTPFGYSYAAGEQGAIAQNDDDGSEK